MPDAEPTLAEVEPTLEAAESVLDLRSSAEPVVDLRSSPEPVLIDQLSRQRLFDLDFVDAESLEPVLSSLLQRRRPDDDSRMETVLTPNVDIMVHLTQPGAEESVEWRMFRQSQYCLPDGQPIVLASRLLGRRLGARLTGSGLFELLWPRLVTDGRSVFMVGSSAQVVARLEHEYADLRSTVAPMFKVDDVDTIDGLADTVIASAAGEPLDYVILGIGNPKDALIAESLLRRWPSRLGRPPTILALGGAASMYVGITKRAPAWVQRIGMEWFYRFLQEPRRLFNRYFIRDVRFVKIVWRHWLDGRRPGRTR